MKELSLDVSNLSTDAKCDRLTKVILEHEVLERLEVKLMSTYTELDEYSFLRSLYTGSSSASNIKELRLDDMTDPLIPPLQHLQMITMTCGGMNQPIWLSDQPCDDPDHLHLEPAFATFIRTAPSFTHFIIREIEKNDDRSIRRLHGSLECVLRTYTDRNRTFIHIKIWDDFSSIVYPVAKCGRSIYFSGVYPEEVPAHVECTDALWLDGVECLPLDLVKDAYRAEELEFHWKTGARNLTLSDTAWAVLTSEMSN